MRVLSVPICKSSVCAKRPTTVYLFLTPFCSANSSIVGLQLNCNNRLPEKNIQSDCLAYSDAAIQEILDMGYFTEPFDFEAAAPEAAPTGGDEGGSSGTVFLSTVCGVMTALVMTLIRL